MRSISDTTTVTVAGAGLAGSLMAILLARRGFNVEVFERWPDPRSEDVPAGRSINLALGERGWNALRTAGLDHRVSRFTLPMKGRMIHDLEGHVSLQPYGQKPHEVVHSVHRGRLNMALLDAAEDTRRVRIHFRQELKHLDVPGGVATFLDHASNREYQREVSPIIGADGAGSPVRQAIESCLGFNASSELLDHGYMEVTIPPENGEFALDPEGLHIWPRGGFMMIGLPNADKSFTGTLFLANEGEPSFEKLESYARFKAFFDSHFPDAVPRLKRLKDDYETNPVGVLGTIRCPHWHVGGDALIIGDAAHAIVPFHGQGMNCAFEDCVALDAILEEATTWEVAFERLEAARKGNANAIADMALENYLEMRSDVIDPGYQLRRELALELERRFPDRFIPRYSMVMFNNMGYIEAQRRGEINRRILSQLTKQQRSIDRIDFDYAEQLIQDQLPILA